MKTSNMQQQLAECLNPLRSTEDAEINPGGKAMCKCVCVYVGGGGWMCVRACTYVCVCVRVRACVCVCVCGGRWSRRN